MNPGGAYGNTPHQIGLVSTRRGCCKGNKSWNDGRMEDWNIPLFPLEVVALGACGGDPTLDKSEIRDNPVFVSVTCSSVETEPSRKI